MADAETPAPKKTIDPAVIIVAYVCGAIGLIFILGISFCVLRRIRWRRARKYIKQQSKRAQAMGPTLTSQPPKTPFTLKSVKAGIKARDEERKVELGVPQPTVPISTITKGETSNGHGRPGGYATLGQPKAKVCKTLIYKQRLKIRWGDSLADSVRGFGWHPRWFRIWR